MPPKPPAAAAPSPARRGRARKWLAAAAIFAAGALTVGLPVGLLSGGSPTGPGPEPSAAPGPGASGAAGQVTVNTSCIQAIRDAQTVRAQLNKLGRAAQQLNFGQLDQVIRKLEPIQNRLDADSRACRIVTQLPGGSQVTSRPALPATPASPSHTPQTSPAPSPQTAQAIISMTANAARRQP
jgi:hypothetical protein